MAKSLAAPYEAGSRGAAWLKIKVAHTLDLVVLAAEWGSGRRHGWLSNLHLGARDPDGGFVMLGKTFKGLTDEMLEWQTATARGARARAGGARLRRARAAGARGRDRVQRAASEPPLSRRPRAALRARRSLPRRQDGGRGADTIETVRAIAAGQRTRSRQPNSERSGPIPIVFCLNSGKIHRFRTIQQTPPRCRIWRSRRAGRIPRSHEPPQRRRSRARRERRADLPRTRRRKRSSGGATTRCRQKGSPTRRSSSASPPS